MEGKVSFSVSVTGADLTLPSTKSSGREVEHPTVSDKVQFGDLLASKAAVEPI